MEEIRLSQTQIPSSASSAAGYESLDDSVSAPAVIDERVITDQVLGVQRRQRKVVGCIIKGRRKAPDTLSSSATIGFSEQSGQVAEKHRLLREQVYAQERELKALKVFITQTIGPPPPSPPPLPSPPPSSDDVEDLRRH